MLTSTYSQKIFGRFFNSNKIHLGSFEPQTPKYAHASHKKISIVLGLWMVWLLSPAHKQWRVLGFSLGLPHLVRHATSAGKRRPSLCFSILSECRLWENRWSRASVQIHVYYAGEREDEKTSSMHSHRTELSKRTQSNEPNSTAQTTHHHYPHHALWA